MLTPSEVVELPMGLVIDGEIYRTVHIDEMSGYDEEALSDKKHRNNGAKAMTAFLRRGVQEIPGLMPRKKDPYGRAPSRYLQEMRTPDRDFLFICIQLLGGDRDLDFEAKCPVASCSDTVSVRVDPAELDVLDWPDGEPHHMWIDLPRGIDYDGTRLTRVQWTFPSGAMQERLAALPQKKFTTGLLTTCITEVEGLDIPIDSETVRRMRTRDRMFILNQVKEMTPGVDLRQDVTCPECGHEWVEEVDPSLFFRSVGVETQRTTKSGKRGRRNLKRR